MNKYVGESERSVRRVFERARSSKPCVIFFDEIDALAARRQEGANSGATRIVNQLLTEMDGLEERKDVFIMGATNRVDMIDPAVMRPGRFDKTLYVGLPTESDKMAIFEKATKFFTRPCLSASAKNALEGRDCDFSLFFSKRRFYFLSWYFSQVYNPLKKTYSPEREIIRELM